MSLRVRAAFAALFFVLFASIGVAYLANKAPSIDRILVSEGGYTNDREDPGGCTNWGITIFDTRLYVKKSATCTDVKKLTRAQAVTIYDQKYWNALSGDALPSGLDYTLVDYGLNSGIARAGHVLRQILGLPTSDWHVTPEVLAAVKGRADTALIRAVNAERSAFLHRLKTCPTFCGGWDKRVRSVNAISLNLAAGSFVPLPAPVLPPPALPAKTGPKAPPAPPPPPPKTWWKRLWDMLPSNPFVRWTPLEAQPGPGKAT
jgi:lysozyme family protein